MVDIEAPASFSGANVLQRVVGSRVLVTDDTDLTAKRDPLTHARLTARKKKT
jgi:hypothetical protein